MSVRTLVGLLALLCAPCCALRAATPPEPALAIVVQDSVPLRATPRDSGRTHALLWQGETLEVRGERLDYLQVWDYRRERGGYVRASQVRRLALTPEEAPELLALVRFLRSAPGAEALGIGLAAAYIRAAPAAAFHGGDGVQALDALGDFAERLAQRASSGAAQGKAAQAALSAHLDVAVRYGVAFRTQEKDGRVRICYDGDAFRRVLAMDASPQQLARAALALTRPDCGGDELRPRERRLADEWKAGVLERVETAALPGYLRNRVHMRRAAVWASLAYQRARGESRPGEAAAEAAQRAIAALAAVSKGELTDADAAAFSRAAMRVNASRWAATPDAGHVNPARPHVITAAGEPGETCILLVDAKRDASRPLARRCTYGLVWTGSATLNREGNALALAVQSAEAWRELWLFRKAGGEWTVRVLPPAPMAPGVGYAEFAGWVPGGTQLLVAREAAGEGKPLRNFELLRLDTLAPVRQTGDPAMLAAFQRWQDPAWKRETLSLR
ncbi:MAG TPA: hypothetical protein VI229_01645 [Burkholderiales bacterium]